MYFSCKRKYKKALDKHKKHLELKDNDWVLLWFTKAKLKQTTRNNWKGDHTSHQKY